MSNVGVKELVVVTAFAMGVPLEKLTMSVKNTFAWIAPSLSRIGDCLKKSDVES